MKKASPPAEAPIVDPEVSARVRLDCTYCRGALEERTVHCERCLAPHHPDCFTAHGRCCAPGCDGRAWVEARRPDERRRFPTARAAAALALAIGALALGASARTREGASAGVEADDTTPVRTGPLTVTAELEQAKVYDPREPVHMVVRLEGEAQEAAERQPVQVVLAVDVSGSMQSGGKIEFARRAVQSFAQGLGPRDSCVVLAFNEGHRVVAPWFQGTGGDERPAWLDSLTAGGGTNILGAIQAAGQLFADYDASERCLQGWTGLRRVVVLTDGRGSNADGLLLAEARRLQADGIGLSCHGFGGDVNGPLLCTLAEAGSGQFLFVDSGARAIEAFDRELQSVVATVARGTELRIEPAPGVIMEQIVSWQARREGNAQVIRVGDVTSEVERKVIVRLRWSNPENASTIPMANLSWTTTGVRDGESFAGSSRVAAAQARSESEALASIRPHLAERLADARFASSMSEVQSLLQAGDFMGAQVRAQQARSLYLRARPGALAELQQRGFVTSDAVQRFYETGELQRNSADQVFSGGVLPVGK